MAPALRPPARWRVTAIRPRSPKRSVVIRPLARKATVGGAGSRRRGNTDGRRDSVMFGVRALAPERETTSGRPLTECRGRVLPLPLEGVKNGGLRGARSLVGWVRGRPLTDFGRRRPNPPLLLERPLRNPGVVARKTPHRIRPKTAESASPLGEGEERRPLDWTEPEHSCYRQGRENGRSRLGGRGA